MLNTFWRYNIYWFIWLCLISYLSNAPSDGIPSISFLNFKGADKVIHAVFYFNLMLFMSWGLRKQHYFQSIKGNYFLFSFFFCLAWGGLMELCQLFIFTYRSAEWLDFLANSIGATLSLVMLRILWKSSKNA